jgi:hypothetical protein
MKSLLLKLTCAMICLRRIRSWLWAAAVAVDGVFSLSALRIASSLFALRMASANIIRSRLSLASMGRLTSIFTSGGPACFAPWFSWLLSVISVLPLLPVGNISHLWGYGCISLLSAINYTPSASPGQPLATSINYCNK